MSAPVAVSSLSLGDHLRMYVELSRPRVLLLVLFTGLPVLAMSQGGWPTLITSFWVLAGAALAGSACSALNAYVERDIDARMSRTRNRPLPAASLMPQQALGYGLVMSVVSTAVLYACGGWLAAAVGAGTIVFYVLVYTMYLKPRTPQNIVIGGAAGATTPLIADAALDGRIGTAGIVLFLIIFLWTPPHFWAIALYRKKEYAAAGLPMMPLVVGDQGTRWRQLAYTLSLIPVSLIPVYTGDLGWLYGAAAAALGIWFTIWNVRAIKARSYRVDRKVFMTSNLYLMALFAVMLVDLAVAL